MPNKVNDLELSLDIIAEKLTAMTAQEFLNLGADGLSYIKDLGKGKDGSALYALHAGDGSHIATGQDPDALRVIAKQHHTLPMQVQ